MKMKQSIVSLSQDFDFDIDGGPKKPNEEFNNSKIITAAASSYIEKELHFSPGANDNFKVMGKQGKFNNMN